jgi:Alpha/beta hydrolase
MSAITLADLLGSDPTTFANAAASWKGLADDLDKAAGDLNHGTQDLIYAWPSGPASAAAGAKVDSLRAEVNAAYNPANRIAQALDDHARAMTDLRNQAQQVIDGARAQGYGVDVVAQVVTAPLADWNPAPNPSSRTQPSPQPQPAPVDPSRPGPSAQDLATQHAQEIANSLGSLVARARGLDDSTANTISQNLPDPVSGFGTLTMPAVSRDDMLGQKGRDPKSVNEWWRSLTPAQQDQVIADYPDLVGWLDGVPAVDRDKANRINLERQRAALNNQKSDMYRQIDELNRRAASEGWSDERADSQKISDLLNQIAAINKKITGLDVVVNRLNRTDGPQAYLLGLSTDGNGRAIVSVGNPDVADNVATYVPGTYAKLDGDIAGDINRADTMAKDAGQVAPGERTAVVMWLGYDAPQSVVPAAMHSDYAVHAAADLRRFEDGLRVTHDGSIPAHQTVLGHSYGTTVVGYAAGSGSLNADDVVFVASPGVGVDHASELHLTGYGSTEGHVYATTAEHDIIAKAGGPKQLVAEVAGELDPWYNSRVDGNLSDPRYLILGQSPVNGDFGATVFASDPGSLNAFDAHSQYWDRNNIARKGMAKIVVGDGASLR